MRKLLAVVLMLGLCLTGCDTANQAANDATNSATDAAKGAAGAVKEAAENFKVGGVDLKDSAMKLVSGLKDTLGKVTDEASAKAALPSLEGMLKTVTGLGESVDNLPATARQTFSGMFSESLPSIKDLIEKVSNMPGVGPILKPVLDQIMERLLNL